MTNMSVYVTRQTPESIRAKTNKNVRKAVVGFAALFAAMIGVTVAGAHTVKEKATQLQSSLESSMLPDYVPSGSPNYTPPQLRTVAQEKELHGTHSNGDALKAVGYAGGALGIAFGSLILLGASSKRRIEGDDYENDVATAADYALTSEERYVRDRNIATLAMAKAVEDEVARHEDQGVLVGVSAARLDYRARLQSPLNNHHQRALIGMGAPNPDQAFDYPFVPSRVLIAAA